MDNIKKIDSETLEETYTRKIEKSIVEDEIKMLTIQIDQLTARLNLLQEMLLIFDE